MAQCRPLTAADFEEAQALYHELVGRDVAGIEAFEAILAHPGTTIFGAERDDRILAVATLHILPNITYGERPYALIENVVTARAAQGQGLGRLVMETAAEAAWAQNVYKIMLLTGRQLGARGFYERLGYAADQKHGMVLRRAPQRQPTG